jgi:hypothetical protein
MGGLPGFSGTRVATRVETPITVDRFMNVKERTVRSKIRFGDCRLVQPNQRVAFPVSLDVDDSFDLGLRNMRFIRGYYSICYLDSGSIKLEETSKIQTFSRTSDMLVEELAA